MRYHCVVFNKHKPKPAWLCRQGLANAVSWRYWNRIWDAQPLWANTDTIREIYKDAHIFRLAGHDVVVDHHVPLTGPNVSGLHVPSNLRIIARRYNAQISNHHFPGNTFEQFDLFGVPDSLKYGGIAV